MLRPRAEPERGPRGYRRGSPSRPRSGVHRVRVSRPHGSERSRCHDGARGQRADSTGQERGPGPGERSGRYLRSRQGELEPVCMSSSLSSLSAELWAQGRCVRWALDTPTALPRPAQARLPPSLLDNGVHGRDVLGHEEGLAVGHVVEGGARVARQDDLQQTPRRLRDPPPPSCAPPAPQSCGECWLGPLAPPRPVERPRVPCRRPDTVAAHPPCTYLPARSSRARPRVQPTLTSVPLDRSSLTKGKTPKMTSTPLLSAKIKAHL